RWTVDPGTRRLLDRGARRYRPTGRLRAHLLAAHGRCGFPGCDRPAELCDCDHTVTFRRGGTTTVVNLGPLCRQHHNAKTNGGWRLHVDPDTGVKTWTSPLGKTYTKGTDPILE
ncbi:MAG: HNH endonuclease signature motif containing protein, partial [Actinomycetes bacterium]